MSTDKATQAVTAAPTPDVDDLADRMVSGRFSRDEQAYIVGLIRADLSPAPTMPAIPKDGTDAAKLHAEFSAFVTADAHWRTVEAPKIGLADRVESFVPRTRITKKDKAEQAEQSTGADGAEQSN